LMTKTKTKDPRPKTKTWKNPQSAPQKTLSGSKLNDVTLCQSVI
jgi:hypothetical protein